MNKQTITFTASEQTLTKTGGIEHYASNIVSYIEASFTLGDNWTGYDSIRAVWESGYARIATVLDANNKCIVPAEVLTYKSKVNVNLVGSIVENTVLTDRLTTYPILALTVDADARVDSSETTPVTASQFEQFVDVVRDEASAIQNYTYDSEAWAVGQRAGVDVPSTDETYQNNAKYYADQGATLQQEVSDLKSEISEIGDTTTEHFVSTNCLDTSKSTADYSLITSTGLPTSNGNFNLSDYIDAKGKTTFRFYRTNSTGSHTEEGYHVMCQYDSNKSFISGTGIIDTSPVTLEENCAYIRVSYPKTNQFNEVVFDKALAIPTDFSDYFDDYYEFKYSDEIEKSETILEDISEKGSVIYSTSTDSVQKYATDGYLNYEGAFVSHSSYSCYYFTMPETADVWFDNPTGWHEIAVYTDDIFDTSKLVVIKRSTSDVLPSYDTPLNIQAGEKVVVCIAKNSDFALHIGTGEYVVKLTETKTPKIIITPIYASVFTVDILDEGSGKYLKHWFRHNYYTKTVPYGDNQSKEVVCGDVWLCTDIHDESGEILLQGNTNFIHYLDMQGHTGHVGAGHGCTVQDFALFFADGKQFDPATLNHTIECDYFKFTTRAKHYLIDTSQTQSSSEAVPTLDDDGNPIVTSIWTFDGEWSVNNRIKMRNQLKFVYDGIRFVQCHAGMLCGFHPDTTNVILQGSKKYIWNSTDGTNNTLEGNTDETLFEGGLTSVDANSATLFGDTFIARQVFEQSDPRQYGKNNILANMPPNGDSRIKMYLQPCVCTSSTALIDAGMQVDEFNNGDYLDVNMVRTIDLI